MNRYMLYLLTYAISVITVLVLYESNWISLLRRRKFPPTVPPRQPQAAKDTASNLPDVYLDNNSPPEHFNSSCAPFPRLFDLRFTVEPWQVQETSNGTFELFSAHLDERANAARVRIVAMFDQVKPNQTFHCQLWYRPRKKPEIVETDRLLMLWLSSWGGNRRRLPHPYIVTCPLSRRRPVPMSVSLVERPCDAASNNLKVSRPRVGGVRKNFVVCVKGLNFPFKDISVRLIEWIELVFFLGAEKISFYKFAVHPRIERVLRYYQTKGGVEVVPIMLVGGAPNSPYLQNRYLHERKTERRLQEVIPYNDCLYRHLREFKYVVLLDVDEVIVPAKGTWVDLMEVMRQKKPNRTSFLTRNVYFLDDPPVSGFRDIPDHLYMLRHVFRTRNYSDKGFHVKGFHDTDWVVGLHNHYPFECLGKCRDVLMPPETAHLQHYKNPKKGSKDGVGFGVNSSVKDTRIWAFKDEVIDRVDEVLKEGDIFG